VVGAALILGALAPAGAIHAQSGAQLVVDAEWLKAHVDEPDVVVLHVGRRYAEGHVPGSAALSLDAIAESRGDMNDPGHEMLELPLDLDVARRAFEEVGVSNDSRVVFVFEGRSVQQATRALWTLQVLGKDDAMLLDGGIEAWRAAGGALSAEATTPSPGTLTTPPRMELRVDRDFVRTRGSADGVALLDARRPVSYDGIEEEMEGRAGHIPGASNLHFAHLFDSDARLLPEAELRDLFSAAGVQAGDRVAAYCHIGLWASAVVFVARSLGYDAALYDGSMTEWAADPELPLVTPGGDAPHTP
jgi:thiosulfate/3-mercaptopyruvate sulfurtransferase